MEYRPRDAPIQMSNMEISLFEDAIKLMRSGSPYEAVKEIDQRKRDAGEQ
jgi:hypothetical protein